MGKGDKKTKKGKIAKGSFGVSRPKSKVPALTEKSATVKKGRQVELKED